MKRILPSPHFVALPLALAVACLAPSAFAVTLLRPAPAIRTFSGMSLVCLGGITYPALAAPGMQVSSNAIFPREVASVIEHSTINEQPRVPGGRATLTATMHAMAEALAASPEDRPAPPAPEPKTIALYESRRKGQRQSLARIASKLREQGHKVLVWNYWNYADVSQLKKGDVFLCQTEAWLPYATIRAIPRGVTRILQLDIPFPLKRWEVSPRLRHFDLIATSFPEIQDWIVRSLTQEQSAVLLPHMDALAFGDFKAVSDMPPPLSRFFHDNRARDRKIFLFSEQYSLEYDRPQLASGILARLPENAALIIAKHPHSPHSYAELLQRYGARVIVVDSNKTPTTSLIPHVDGVLSDSSTTTHVAKRHGIATAFIDPDRMELRETFTFQEFINDPRRYALKAERLPLEIGRNAYTSWLNLIIGASSDKNNLTSKAGRNDQRKNTLLGYAKAKLRHLWFGKPAGY